MNYLIDFVIAYPAWVLFINFFLFIGLTSKIPKDTKKLISNIMIGSLLAGCAIAFNSALVKPKTQVEPFKPSEVVTHQMDEEVASKPFTDRLSKPKESKLNESLTFKKEVQEINK